MTLSEELQKAADSVRGLLPPGAAPTVGLILGSGLGSFADTLADRVKVPFEKIPGFAASTIVGHAGNLVYGRAGKLNVLAMQGRIHYYERVTRSCAWCCRRACWSRWAVRRW